MEGLGVIGVDHHRLSLAAGINGVAGDGLGFRHHQCAYHTVDLDLALLIRHIQAVAGDVAVFVRHILAAGSGDLEGDASQGFPGETISLVDDQGAGLGVFDDYGLGITLGADDHIGGGLVHHIALWGLDLRDHVSAGDQVGDSDLTAAVSGKDAVLGEGAVTDDAVQPDFAPGSSRHPELSTGQGLIGFAVPLLDDEGALGGVLKGQADRAPLLDLDRLALRIQDEAVRGAGFGHHHALAGFQAGNVDLAVLIGAEDAVGVSNQGTICVSDLELRILERDAGVDIADLADEQLPVRHILKSDGDDALLTAVCQKDCLGGLDDRVPICRVHLLQNVGAAFQPSPDGGPVFPGDFLADDGPASARGAAQVAQLEGAAG